MSPPFAAITIIPLVHSSPLVRCCRLMRQKIYSFRLLLASQSCILVLFVFSFYPSCFYASLRLLFSWGLTYLLLTYLHHRSMHVFCSQLLVVCMWYMCCNFKNKFEFNYNCSTSPLGTNTHTLLYVRQHGGQILPLGVSGHHCVIRCRASFTENREASFRNFRRRLQHLHKLS